MQFNFAEIIAEQNANLPAMDNFAFAMARTTVVPSEYLWNTVLPATPKPTYYVKGGSMRIYPTMLGLVPMDTPYPPMGAITSAQFFENTTKVGGVMNFPEATLREMREWANSEFSRISDSMGLDAARTARKELLVNAVIGMSTMMLKAQWDTMEWCRSRAMTKGTLTWTYGKIALNIDYDIPTANIKSYTSTDSFYNTASKFWTAIKYVYTRLSAGFTVVMNYQTYLSIINNPVNNIVVTGDVSLGNGLSRKTVQFFDRSLTNYRAVDTRETLTIICYDKSGTVIDKDGNLAAKPFIDDGDIVAIGAEKPEGFEITLGSTADPTKEYELGYTHIAPTEEGGQSAIWQRVFTPEDKPYQLQGETASNFLPVIINPNRVVQIHTEMPS